jgi:hypothetical protein
VRLHEIEESIACWIRGRMSNIPVVGSMRHRKRGLRW